MDRWTCEVGMLVEWTGRRGERKRGVVISTRSRGRAGVEVSEDERWRVPYGMLTEVPRDSSEPSPEVKDVLRRAAAEEEVRSARLDAWRVGDLVEVVSGKYGLVRGVVKSRNRKSVTVVPEGSSGSRWFRFPWSMMDGAKLVKRGCLVPTPPRRPRYGSGGGSYDVTAALLAALRGEVADKLMDDPDAPPAAPKAPPAAPKAPPAAPKAPPASGYRGSVVNADLGL